MRGPRRYVLGADGVPVLEPDLMAWAQWIGTADRRIASDIIGDLWVSTVFLGLDHNFGGGPPVLFECMAFYGTTENDPGEPVGRWRCGGNVEAALVMHASVCARVRAGHVQPWGDVEVDA